jgi:hypothetical protein
MLPSAFLSQIISPSRRTSNRPFAPGVKAIPTSGPKALKNSLATHVAVAWCCQATQYRISTRTFHSPFVAMSTLLTSSYYLTPTRGNDVTLTPILRISAMMSSDHVPLLLKCKYRGHAPRGTKRHEGSDCASFHSAQQRPYGHHGLAREIMMRNNWWRVTPATPSEAYTIAPRLDIPARQLSSYYD